MSVFETRLSRVATNHRVEDHKRLLCQRSQTWTEDGMSATDANRAQQRANSPTDSEPERKDTFRAVAGAVFFK